MANQIHTGAIHHVALTVTDRDRSSEFYTGLLGFQVVRATGPKTLLNNGSLILALNLAPNPERALSDDRFDENRVGLDHLSFTVGSRDELEQAAHLLDERGVSRGEIKDLQGLGLYVLAFRDPDNIQLELTAPYSE
ncbi:MAG: VOC family protein [Ardenticatenaceae bacterium]|nr:VOC family protein [Ardenticatenaceae bacterium]HBY98596.1 glyoxalase [Chloroflexota bacterium]